MLTDTQVKNVEKAINFLLTKVDKEKFSVYTISSNKDEIGCLLHQMYHARRLPAALHVTMSGYNGGKWNVHIMTVIRGMIETCYGRGSYPIFMGEKSSNDTARDTNHFAGLLREYIARNTPQTEPEREHSVDCVPVFLETENGKTYEFQLLDAARYTAKILADQGIKSTIYRKVVLS